MAVFTPKAELSHYDTLYGRQSLKYLQYGLLQKKLAGLEDKTKILHPSIPTPSIRTPPQNWAKLVMFIYQSSRLT